MASVNYRLSSFMYTQHDPPVTWPTHANDVAVAMAWLKREAPSFNGDPARMALIGFSAGAQIVANVGTDPRYLASAGLDMKPLRCTASLDVRLYDIPLAAEQIPAGSSPKSRRSSRRIATTGYSRRRRGR